MPLYPTTIGGTSEESLKAEEKSREDYVHSLYKVSSILFMKKPLIHVLLYFLMHIYMYKDMQGKDNYTLDVFLSLMIYKHFSF